MFSQGTPERTHPLGRTEALGLYGGTGPQGKGLAHRLAAVGDEVVIGSRTPERAQAAADDLNSRLRGGPRIAADTNAGAANRASVAIVAVPYDPQAEAGLELRDELAGKIALSCVNPLGFDAAGPYGLEVPHGSAAEHLAALLPDTTVVVAAFHHVSARNLLGEWHASRYEPLGWVCPGSLCEGLSRCLY